MVELDLDLVGLLGLLDLAALEAAARAVPDPELPVVTLGELGVVRGVTVAADGAVEIAITPTYVGCPATEAIAEDVRAAVVARLLADGVAVVGSSESSARVASGAAQTAFGAAPRVLPSASAFSAAGGAGLLAPHAATETSPNTARDAEHAAPTSMFVSGRAEPHAAAPGADRANADVDSDAASFGADRASGAGADAALIATYVSGSAEPHAAEPGADRATDAGAASPEPHAATSGADRATDSAAAPSAEAAPAVEVRTRTVLSPAWSTDWISEEGRRKLAAHGIAPPSGRRAVAGGPVFVQFSASPAPRPPAADAVVGCPHCGSAETRLISAFGSTPCQSLRACRVCGEPFGAIKTL